VTRLYGIRCMYVTCQSPLSHTKGGCPSADVYAFLRAILNAAITSAAFYKPSEKEVLEKRIAVSHDGPGYCLIPIASLGDSDEWCAIFHCMDRALDVLLKDRLDPDTPPVSTAVTYRSDFRAYRSYFRVHRSEFREYPRDFYLNKAPLFETHPPSTQNDFTGVFQSEKYQDGNQLENSGSQRMQAVDKELLDISNDAASTVSVRIAAGTLHILSDIVAKHFVKTWGAPNALLESFSCMVNQFPEVRVHIHIPITYMSSTIVKRCPNTRWVVFDIRIPRCMCILIQGWCTTLQCQMCLLPLMQGRHKLASQPWHVDEGVYIGKVPEVAITSTGKDSVKVHLVPGSHRYVNMFKLGLDLDEVPGKQADALVTTALKKADLSSLTILVPPGQALVMSGHLVHAGAAGTKGVAAARMHLHTNWPTCDYYEHLPDETTLAAHLDSAGLFVQALPPMGD
jgi:hypothetical protein